MMELRELYQETIIDHNRNPRNHHAMTDASVRAEGFNPLCGDKLTVYLKLQDDIITDVSFVGCGCAISQASASLMTEALSGRTVIEAENIFNRFQRMVKGQDEDLAACVLDKLTVLAGVKAYPARVKCATLAWHTLNAALKKEVNPISTE